MELSEYLSLLRRHAAVIVLAGLLGFAAAYGYATTLPERYTASASLFVAVPGSATVGERVQGANYAQNRVETYAELALTPYVLEPVIEELGLTQSVTSVSRNLEVTSPLNTGIMRIRYTSVDPERAAAAANAVSAELARAVGELEGRGPQSQSAVELTVIAEAVPPAFPSSPNTRLLAATGLAVGLALATLFVVARSVLDTRVRSSKDVAQVTEAAVLTSVRRERRGDRDPVVFRSAPLGDRAEAYRRLRTNLRFLNFEGRSRSILVTSAVPGEGKTTTALNLAVAMAEGSGRVLLIDADLRRPSTARYLGIEGAAGLTSVLIGEASEDDVIQPWGDNLDVLAAGPIPPNPSEMLDSPAMAELLRRLSETYDAIIVDSPPLVPVTDAAALSHSVDGALVVVGCQTVHRSQLTEALTALEAVGARVLGIVLNQVASKDLGTTYVYAHDQRRGLVGRRRTTHRRPSRMSRLPFSRRVRPAQPVPGGSPGQAHATGVSWAPSDAARSASPDPTDPAPRPSAAIGPDGDRSEITTGR